MARVIYKTPPRTDESALDKLRRKLREWWAAPVIYWELTKDGSDAPFHQWIADHLWLAQRTGGQPLHGIEATSRIVFGKSAADLSIAEQFVLASAVNKPIILLQGSEKLNAVRLDRWRYIVDVRARKCAGELIADEARQKEIWFELTAIAGGPPDPQISPAMQTALAAVSDTYAKVAEANPVLRANLLIPETRYGVREEMKQEYGFGWREYVRGVELTIDAARNRAFRNAVLEELTELQKKYGARLGPEFALDPRTTTGQLGKSKKLPDVIVAAANADGEIVRYFEVKDNAAYYGSELAHDARTGHYDRMLETRAIASIGKMISAVGVANEGKDDLTSEYFDDDAPSGGLESCRRGGGKRRNRTAEVSFACSLNRPLEWRTRKLGQANVRRLIDGFGFNMPPAPDPSLETPPSTATVLGMITGSPRTVHRMSAVILASLTGRGDQPVKYPTLVKAFDRRSKAARDDLRVTATDDIVPNTIIAPRALSRLRALLSSPLCYEARGKRYGTMLGVSNWCAARNPNIDLHFGKTGTHVGEDKHATVDVWASGGLRFSNGAAYTYVVMVGTGNSREPWARKLHSSQIAIPLLEVLLNDLAEEVRSSTTGPDRSREAARVQGTAPDHSLNDRARNDRARINRTTAARQ